MSNLSVKIISAAFVYFVSKVPRRDNQCEHFLFKRPTVEMEKNSVYMEDYKNTVSSAFNIMYI